MSFVCSPAEASHLLDQNPSTGGAGRPRQPHRHRLTDGAAQSLSSRSPASRPPAASSSGVEPPHFKTSRILDMSLPQSCADRKRFWTGTACFFRVAAWCSPASRRDKECHLRGKKPRRWHSGRVCGGQGSRRSELSGWLWGSARSGLPRTTMPIRMQTGIRLIWAVCRPACF